MRQKHFMKLFLLIATIESSHELKRRGFPKWKGEFQDERSSTNASVGRRKRSRITVQMQPRRALAD